MRILIDIRDGLASQPGRLLLSLLAIVLGVLVLAALLCLVGGIRQKASMIVQELGVNVLAVMPNDPETPLLPAQLDQLRGAIPNARIAAIKFWPIDTRDGETRLNVLAADAELFAVRPWKVIDGRSLDPRDVGEGQPHCLVSRDLADRMQWRVGQQLGISDQYFSIVGIFEPGSDVGAIELTGSGLPLGENMVIIPATMPPYWVKENEQPLRSFDVAYIKLPAQQQIGDAVVICRSVLQFPSDREHRFSYVTPESLVANLRHLEHTVQWSAGSLALLCMILGGTTLASLMIANVQERVREIGLRMALGAAEWSIGALFVVEALILTLIAGMLGTIVAHAVLFLYQGDLPVPIQLNGYTLLAPVGWALLFAACFAWWPARHAARIRPADALRND